LLTLWDDYGIIHKSLEISRGFIYYRKLSLGIVL
jgi:hypothetical protein